MTIAVVALGVLLFGGLVWFLATEFGGKTEPVQEKSVTATIPDGEVQKMSDSKSEAFRGSVSTDAYFEQLGQKMKADEDISLVSSTDLEAPKPVAAQEPAGAPVERVFGPAPQTAPAPVRRSSGGGGPSSRTMTQQERLGTLIRVGVYAAEQLYRSGEGTRKKAYVIQLLESQGYDIDSDVIDARIEAELTGLKNACRGGSQ